MKADKVGYSGNGYYGLKTKSFTRKVKFVKNGNFPLLKKKGKTLIYAKTLNYDKKTKIGKVKYQFVNTKDFV